MGKNSRDRRTWIPQYWNDTHALLGAIDLAGARNAMMWYIGVSGQLAGGKREPVTYTTPIRVTANGGWHGHAERWPVRV